MSAGVPTETFQPGEFIFHEGADGRTAYIIQDGSVDIFADRDGRRTLLTTLGPGSCFGEMAPLAAMPRTASAVAKTVTNTYVLDDKVLNALLQQSQPVARAIVQSLIGRLRNETHQHLANATQNNPITTMARLLVLLGQCHSDGGSNKPPPRRRRPGETNVCGVPQRVALTMASQLLGRPTYATKAAFHKMAQLNLLELKSQRGDASLEFDLDTVVAHAEKIERAMGNSLHESLKTDIELLELDDFAVLVNAEPRKVLLKISQDPNLANLLVFRKSEALRLIAENGPDYFNKTKIKRIEEFDSIDDVQFIDRETLSEVLGAMEPYTVAQLVKYAPESARERLVSCLSSRIRGVVERMVATLGEVDMVDGEQIQNHVIDAIKRAKGITP